MALARNEKRTDRQHDCETIRVNNRDILILQEVICVMQEVRALETRREWQRERMYNITQHLTGMPSQHGQTGGLEAAFASVAALEDEHKDKVKEYTRKLKAAERIINSIGNHFMRVFVMMMYVENIPPKKVRSELNLSERGFRTARTAVEQAQDMASVKWRDRYILAKD